MLGQPVVAHEAAVGLAELELAAQRRTREVGLEQPALLVAAVVLHPVVPRARAQVGVALVGAAGVDDLALQLGPGAPREVQHLGRDLGRRLAVAGQRDEVVALRHGHVGLAAVHGVGRRLGVDTDLLEQLVAAVNAATGKTYQWVDEAPEQQQPHRPGEAGDHAADHADHQGECA